MALWNGEQRAELVLYLSERDLVEDARLWKLAQALVEVLPRGGEDWKLVSALIGDRETLKSEARQAGARAAQQELGFEGERA